MHGLSRGNKPLDQFIPPALLVTTTSRSKQNINNLTHYLNPSTVKPSGIRGLKWISRLLTPLGNRAHGQNFNRGLRTRRRRKYGTD